MNDDQQDAPREFAITPTATLVRAPGAEQREAAKPGDVLELSNQPQPHHNGYWVVRRVSLHDGIDLVRYGTPDAVRLMRAKAKRERRASRH